VGLAAAAGLHLVLVGAAIAAEPLVIELQPVVCAPAVVG